MTTITFYSYKGGSGRSLLLANIAYYLAAFGQKVFAMDLDLEAPGLHYKLDLARDTCLKIPRGVLDYLHSFITTRRRPVHLTEFVVPIELPPGVVDGRLHLMAAGDAMAGEYWKKLAQINWHDLFYSDEPAGIALFLDLKARIAEDYKPDYLLIDSRTGITETGGVAATLLPDIVVCPILRNRESQEGARQVLRSIARTARERNSPPPRILPVLSRLAEESSTGEAAIVEEVRQFLNQDAPDLADTLSVDYLPVLHWERAIELKETLLATGKLPDAGSTLLQDYLNLFNRLIPAEVTSTRKADVRTIFIGSAGPDLRAYREAVFEALRHIDGWRCIRREDFRDPERDVDVFFREHMKATDVFLGIVGHRFGEGPKGTKTSFGQQEYRAAEGRDLPRLLFLAPDDFPIPANLREPDWKIDSQLKFREHLSKNHVVSTGFTTPSDLANMVVLQVHQWMFASSGEGSKNDTARYLQALRQQTENIDIRGLRTSSGAVYQFRIDALYTPLTTVLAPEESSSRAAPGSLRAVPLQRALQSPRVVLVGDPGAGKSTFLRRIAFAACETLLGNDPAAAGELLLKQPCPFPVLISAAGLSNHIQKHLRGSKGPATSTSPDWLIHYLTENNPDWDAGVFRDRLAGGCLLLLDGIDEVSDLPRRKSMAKLLESAARSYPETQIVATSRPPAYGGETVIPGFETIQIGPLGDAAIEMFVEKWCRALYPAEETARKHQSELLEEIRSKPEIQNMAGNPVMLTALAALHWNQKRLPDQRSELYESVLRWLAESREAQTGRPAMQCLAMMEYLAYAMHTDAKGKQVEITWGAAARILAPRFREVEDAQERVKAAGRFLEDEETDSGILVSRGDTLKFWHLTFQEYLTARALAVRDAGRRRLLFEDGKLYLPEWRETVLLLAGVLCGQDAERVDSFLGEMLGQLGDKATLAERARCVGLMGRILRDLRSWNYRVADKRYQENLDLCLAIFDAKQVRKIGFETRLEAADALGQAGDPRLEGDHWVRVEGGSFWMGAQKTDPNGKNYDPEADDDESPVHIENVGTFWMGRYPVTVQEYARFIEMGGYQKQVFWSAGGFGEFSEPEAWQQQSQYQSRPVVGVSWFEAAAFCAWNKRRLPSEAEWEYAARGGREGVRYPWGDEEPDEFRANFFGGNSPMQPTPVGMYPDGATPSGIQDLAGNVLEWTSSQGVRGGSWYVNPWRLRVSNRGGDGPRYRGGYVGFRCVGEVHSL